MTATAVGIGPWLLEPGPDGVALRRNPDADAGPTTSGEHEWSSVEWVPPQGAARRVVVLGESTARGWPFESVFSPTSVLQRQLDSQLDGSFQCVDLAKVGATAEELLDVARRLPLLRPSVVVSFAGNNWLMPPRPISDGKMEPVPGLPGALAAGLRAAGYPGLREAFASRMLRYATEYLDHLLALRRDTGAAVVVVIPEFNLRGFVPPADVQAPVMGPADTRRWHELRGAAERALAAGEHAAVAELTCTMAAVDGGCSPVPGWLAGQAAIALGDGAAAREALERSRDAVVGLLLRHPPRAPREVQELLRRTAHEHGLPCVDLREVLADPELPQLPDPACFHDYCHLSDTGVERAVAAIATAVLDNGLDERLGERSGEQPHNRPNERPGERRPVRPGPGLSPSARAFGHARGAVHLAFQAQPVSVLAAHLRAALHDEPAMAGLLRDARDLLAAPPPRWGHPALERLSTRPDVHAFATALAGSGPLGPEMWTLVAAFDEVLGRNDGQPPPPAVIDLLACAEVGGHPLPNWTPPRSHLVACSSRTTLAFDLDAPRELTLELEYRTPLAEAGATITVHPTGTRLPASTSWTGGRVDFPASVTHPGVNEIHLDWPLPRQDPLDAVEEDARAVERGEFPMVLPVFGELFDARLVRR